MSRKQDSVIESLSFLEHNYSQANTSIPQHDDLFMGETLEDFITFALPVVFGAIVLVGLIGNSLVVIVIQCNKKLKSTTNILVINLALGDLLFIVCCVPFTATNYVLRAWGFGNVWCHIYEYLTVVAVYISIYTLVLMSVDRYLAVVRPVSSRSTRTENNTAKVVGILWVSVLVSCFPAGLCHGEIVQKIGKGLEIRVCTFLVEHYQREVYQAVFFITSYILPLSVIIYLYVSVVRRLWGVKALERDQSRGKKKITLLVIIVVVTFAACWFPIQCILLLKSLNSYPMSEATVVLQIIAQVLAYTNSCINPILYAFLSENFRRAFWRLVHRPPHQRFKMRKLSTNDDSTKALNSRSSKMTP